MMGSTEREVSPDWPNGSRFAVAVTVNLDGESLLLAEDPSFEQREKSLSIMRYGANRGVERLLDVFAEKGVASTWFVTGRVAESDPELVRRVAAAGHQIAARGYALERFDRLDSSTQQEVVRRGAGLLADLAGAPIDGFRLPSGEWPIGLGGLLRESGISWSSSFYGDDFPFHLPSEEGGLVDIPISYGLDDRIAFFWNYSPPMPAGQPRISSYAEVLSNWLYELEGCRREGLCFVIQLHPEICATPGRISLVRDLLDAITSYGDGHVATCGGIADWWRSQGHPNDPSHPVELFARLRSQR
jgi:peptidoglycan/xylan/chitin deacetylase (PgdA/CDA1 family)